MLKKSIIMHKVVITITVDVLSWSGVVELERSFFLIERGAALLTIEVE